MPDRERVLPPSWTAGMTSCSFGLTLRFGLSLVGTRTDSPRVYRRGRTGAKYCGHCASPMRTLLMPESEVTAVILAAGVARRLSPLTGHTRKSLLPLGGRGILARSVEARHAA